MAQRRRGVRTAGIVLVLVASCSWVAPARSQPRVVTSEDAAAETAEAVVATETTALVGDFNGDKRKDLFWYGPEAGPTTCGWVVPTGTSPGCRCSSPAPTSR